MDITSMDEGFKDMLFQLGASHRELMRVAREHPPEFHVNLHNNMRQAEDRLLLHLKEMGLFDEFIKYMNGKSNMASCTFCGNMLISEQCGNKYCPTVLGKLRPCQIMTCTHLEKAGARYNIVMTKKTDLQTTMQDISNVPVIPKRAELAVSRMKSLANESLKKSRKV